MKNFLGQLDFVKKEISDISDIKDTKRRIWGTVYLKDFVKRSAYAFQLIFQEKEIIIFALLQWAVIGLIYYLWVQALGWIPEYIWQAEGESSGMLISMVLMAWTFLCIGLAAFPLSILSGCMGASHFLTKQGYPSTIAGCVKLVSQRLWNLWIFHWIDGWITANQVLERLPKKGGRGPAAKVALNELLYYAWKLGTIGVLPAILNGRNLIAAGKESIDLVRKHPQEAVLLRGGYSLFCWVVGIVAYVGSIIFFISQHHLFAAKPGIYGFYFLMGVPVIIATGTVLLFLRPIYVIASCSLYSDYVALEKIDTAASLVASKTVSAIIAFIILAIIIAVAFLYRDQLGITKILSGY
ncbi:MAG: hypothetical protein ABIA66_01845 [Candidatus Omnitrophota bacterium]